MNLEKTSNNVSSKKTFRKICCAKSAALSFSLMLGACAATGDKVEPNVEPSSSEAVKERVVVQESAQVQEKTAAPSAKELMKSLKAPLVEPPEAQATPKVVKQEPLEKEKAASAAVEEQKQKIAVEQERAQEKVKKFEPVVDKVKQDVKPAPAVVAVKPVTKPRVAEPVVVEKGSSSSTKPFNVSVNKLPFTYDIWTIRDGDNHLTKGLVIVTPTWEMGKQGYMSQIWFTMMEDAIHVNSSSDIEPASKGLGIRIDGGDLIPFTSIAEKNVGIISGKWLDRLAAANKIDVYLGFFPGKKPTSDTFVSDLSLNNLSRMVSTYRMLSQ